MLNRSLGDTLVHVPQLIAEVHEVLKHLNGGAPLVARVSALGEFQLHMRHTVAMKERRRTAQHLRLVAFHVGLEQAHVTSQQVVDAHRLRHVPVRVVVARATLDQPCLAFHRRHAALHVSLSSVLVCGRGTRSVKFSGRW